MIDFIAQYSDLNEKRINDDMFMRRYDRPLHEFIVDICKNLEVIPGLTLESWELITDQTKIKSTIDKKNAKDPKIKNNKTLETLTQPNRTLCDILILNFRIRIKGYDISYPRKVRILKRIKGGMYLRNGKKVRLLNQVVDNSTFVKKTVLNFKTILYSIKLDTKKVKLKFTDGTAMSCHCYELDLLYKVVNPLHYYLAQYGLQGTIEMFDLERVMSIVDYPLDESYYMYLKVNDGCYIEIQKGIFYAHPFISAFVATMYDVMTSDKDMTFRDVYNKDYWMGRLAEIYSKKRYANKALRILVSFNKIVDVGLKKRLVLRKRHKRNTFTIIRWMMTDFVELLKKDSHDLRYKRIRANETLAYYFDKHVSKNVYSLLNTDNPSLGKYIQLLNSIDEYTLLKGADGGGKTAGPTSMFRYERYNDFDAIEISRYTLKGPTGLNGGKHGVAVSYRDIYTSHYGRYDVNVCTGSDPGLTGYLCANVQLDGNGYFVAGDTEPDDYDRIIDVLLDKYAEDDYARRRDEYIRMQLSRDENGFIRLKRKMTPAQMQKEFLAHPGKYGFYRTKQGLKLIPKMPENAKGFKVLTRLKPGANKPKEERDENGFLILRRIVTKASKWRK